MARQSRKSNSRKRSSLGVSPDILLNEVLDTVDTGDDTQHRFRYQHAYGVILLLAALSGEQPYTVLWCEHYEDLLGERTDGLFDAYQIKTRRDGLWNLSDDPLKDSIRRFVEIDQRFSGQIKKFFFVSNAPYENSNAQKKVMYSPKKFLQAIKHVSSPSDLIPPFDKTFEELRSHCDCEALSFMTVLKKLDLLQGPGLDSFKPEICQRHLSVIHECHPLSAEALAQMFEGLIAKVCEASCLDIGDPARHWYGLTEDDRDNPKLQAKRIPLESVQTFIRENQPRLLALTKYVVSSIQIIDAIGRVGKVTSWEKGKRQEIVSKLLEQFKIDSANPPIDFENIYTYALVEYGVGQPEPILNFFRYPFIRETFKQSFYKNDSSILNAEAEDTIEWDEEISKLGKIDYDPRREFVAFSIIFNEIVDRTRNPSEVKRDHMLADLHEDIGSIMKRLEQISTLSDMRSEATRITQTSALEFLAHHMKAWFEALDYHFENYQVQEENYFEWIIKVPAWRRYELVLIRGIEGEAGIKDIHLLHDSVNRHKTDRGCLVAARRISQAATNEVKKKDYQNLSCCTFDELLEQDADFSTYFSWLEEEVKARGVSKQYIPLACIKEEYDPATGRKIAENSYDEQNGWIEGYIDQWLDDPSKQHISILGEFGTGKTWFALHYAWKILQDYKMAKTKGKQRGRIPLVISLRDYAKALDLENVLARFFFHKHNLRFNKAVFDQLNRMGKLLLIFDGFDEMAAKVDQQKMVDNFWELARALVPGAKAILTCRNEHFPDAQSGRALLNAQLKASTANLTGQSPQFEVLKLKPFSKDQILQVLATQAKPATVKKIASNTKLMELARRPLMIELIMEALPEVNAGKNIDLSRIYWYAMQRKMERDIKEERTFTSLLDKLYFMCEISSEMLLTNQMSLNYKLFPDKIRQLFGPVVQQQKDLDHWRFDMMGQALLIRNDDGDYSPAHKSFLEFFVAYKIAAELGILALDYTSVFRDKQKSAFDGIHSEIYTWSTYFKHKLDEKDRTKPLPYLHSFATEDVNKLAETLGKLSLSLTIWKFLENMMLRNKEDVISLLLSCMKQIQGKTVDQIGLVGSNIVLLLTQLDPLALRGYDLSRISLQKLSFHFTRSRDDRPDFHETLIDLSNANLQATNLEDAVFDWNVNLAGANFQFSNLAGVYLPLSQLDSLSFHPVKNQLVTGSHRDIILWDLEKQRVHTRVYGATAWDVKHSPDGKYLLNSTWGGFEIRDAQTLEVISCLENSKAIKDHKVNNRWTSAFTFSADGSLLFVGNNDSAIYIWDFMKLQEIAVLTGHTSHIQSVSLHTNEKHLVSRSWHELITWDISTGEKISERRWHGSSSGIAKFIPHKMLIAATVPEEQPREKRPRVAGKLHILDPFTMNILDIYSLEEVSICEFSQDGSQLCFGNHNGFEVLDSNTRVKLASVELKNFDVPIYLNKFTSDDDPFNKKNLGSLKELSFDSTGRFIAGILRNGHVIIYDIKDQIMRNIFCHLPNVTNADFRYATGIDNELQKQLMINGAIME